MIEIWLSEGTRRLRLPVLPAEVALTTSGGAQRVNLLELGEVILPGKRGLRSLQLASYFPARYDGNCQYQAIPAPSEAVQLLQSWIEVGAPIRLIITGGGYTINMQVLIETGSFTFGKAAEEVAYSLTLTEYRPLAVKRV